jgi:serine/threonine protein kinase
MLNSEHSILTVLDKVRLALDVSEAVRFLHDSNFYHRDLKSIYVLVDGDNRAKLTGFGGTDDEEGWLDASQMHCNGQMTSSAKVKRMNKMIADTVEEQNQREQADIIAFGVIMWELATGKVPKQHATSAVKGKQGGPSGNNFLLTEDEIKQYPVGFTRLMQQCLAPKEQSVSTFKGFDVIYTTLHELWLDEIRKMKEVAKVVPDGFLCPITQDVMRDPVMLIDGHSYERKAITDWLKRSNRSPLTNEELPMMSKDANMPLMVDNYALKSAIVSFSNNM